MKHPPMNVYRVNVISSIGSKKAFYSLLVAAHAGTTAIRLAIDSVARRERVAPRNADCIYLNLDYTSRSLKSERVIKIN